jgi:hypothetical protein
VTFSSPGWSKTVREKYFEHPRTRTVRTIGLVCAKSRRAGQFSCFLIGITGGSLFSLSVLPRFLASIP